MKKLLHVPLFAALIMIFFFTPEEASQGLVQKIFYIHVSSAITMYLAFFIAFLSSILYLSDQKIIWDEVSVSAVEVGLLFCSIVLVTGPIWARPIWGTWWTWEPRLTTTFLLFMLYVSYLIARQAITSHRKARMSAVISIVAFIDVPLIHYSVKLWRGIHPSVINNKSGGLPASMQITLAVAMLSMILFFTSLFLTRWKIEKNKNNLEKLKAALSEEK